MKCPVCNSTFEPTLEEEKNSQPWGIKICSKECWCKTHKGQNPSDHRWEYHIGDTTPVPPPGGSLGRIDHSKFTYERKRSKSHNFKSM